MQVGKIDRILDKFSRLTGICGPIDHINFFVCTVPAVALSHLTVLIVTLDNFFSIFYRSNQVFAAMPLTRLAILPSTAVVKGHHGFGNPTVDRGSHAALPHLTHVLIDASTKHYLTYAWYLSIAQRFLEVPSMQRVLLARGPDNEPRPEPGRTNSMRISGFIRGYASHNIQPDPRLFICEEVPDKLLHDSEAALTRTRWERGRPFFS
jgi:hypothetical protein